MEVVCVPLAVISAAMWYWDFPGGPAVKASPSSEGGVGSIPGQGADSTQLVAKKTKHKIEVTL